MPRSAAALANALASVVPPRIRRWDMHEAPWLTVLGLGEDGLDGLSPASRQVLDRAEVVMGPPRHLALVPENGAERIAWPVP